jgi:hypothetical protein
MFVKLAALVGVCAPLAAAAGIGLEIALARGTYVLLFIPTFALMAGVMVAVCDLLERRQATHDLSGR